MLVLFSFAILFFFLVPDDQQNDEDDMNPNHARETIRGSIFFISFHSIFFNLNFSFCIFDLINTY